MDFYPQRNLRIVVSPGMASSSRTQPGKLAQYRNIVQCLLYRCVGIAKPRLHQVDAQHSCQGKRAPTSAIRRAVSCNQALRLMPTHQLFHRLDKGLAPGSFGFFTNMGRRVRLASFGLICRKWAHFTGDSDLFSVSLRRSTCRLRGP